MPVINLGSIDKGYKVAFGEHATVAASDTVASGLSTVLYCVGSVETDLSDDLIGATVTNSTSGNLTIKSWKNTSGSDPTPAAATSFGAKVHWLAVGY